MSARERKEQRERSLAWRNGLTSEQRDVLRAQQAKWRQVGGDLSGAMTLLAQADMGCAPTDHCRRCNPREMTDKRRASLRRGAMSNLYSAIALLAELGYGPETPQDAPGRTTGQAGDTSANPGLESPQGRPRGK